MAIVVRLGPLPLQHRRGTRVAELERILDTAVELIEVVTVAELVASIRAPEVVALTLDAPHPGELTAAVEAAVSLPVLRPLWRRQRNRRGETDEVVEGYGLLTAADIVGLADGELSTSQMAGRGDLPSPRHRTSVQRPTDEPFVRSCGKARSDVGFSIMSAGRSMEASRNG